MEPGAEVRGDDHLVLEPLGAGDDVVEVGVAELVDDSRRARRGRRRSSPGSGSRRGRSRERRRAPGARYRPGRRPWESGSRPRPRRPTGGGRGSRCRRRSGARYSGLSFLRRSQTRKPSEGIVCLVANGVTTSSRESAISWPGSTPTSLAGIRPRSSRWKARRSISTASTAVDRQVDRGRLHLHHPPPGHVDRQRREVVEVGMRDEPVRRRHERPGLRHPGRSPASARAPASRSGPPPANTLRSSGPCAPATAPARCPPDGRAIRSPLQCPPPTTHSFPSNVSN